MRRVHFCSHSSFTDMNTCICPIPPLFAHLHCLHPLTNTTHCKIAEDEVTKDQDTGTAEDSLLGQSGIIPGTPPAKKVRVLMLG